jgi:hypothetical protein
VRITSFDKQAIADIKRFVNAELKALIERGFHKWGDVENRLGYHVGTGKVSL